MSEHLFSITSHIIPAAHIRGLSRGVQDDQNGQLRLAVKHYVPKNRPSQLGDPTLIIAHGIGTPKECHEPFLDDLIAHLPIRGAWTCDVTTHSASYVLNEHLLGEWGTESDIGGSSYPQIIVGQVEVGDEGNGGVAAGKVESVHIKGARHSIHLDMPGKAAEAVSEWLRKELKDWHNEM